MFPEAGGSASFARHAFNELVSFVAGWGQMLNYIITVAISAFFVPHYLGVFWEPLRTSPGDIIAGIVLIAALAALNIKGTQESAKLNLVLAIGDLATQVLLVVVGLVLVFSPDTLIGNIDLGVAPTWSDFALGIALGMIAYTGIETISNMSEEAIRPEKSIPRGTGLVVLAVLGLYSLLPMIALSAMPVTLGPDGYTTELGTTYASDPVLGIVENLGLGAGLTDALRIYVGVLAAVILVIATNAGMIGVSRLTFSMGQHRQLPERLRQVHPKYRTPHVAIITFSIIASIALIPGQVDLLATMYSFGAMLSFTIAHVAILWMRRRHADVEREWKPPGEVTVAGVEIPMTAVLGGLGTFAAWIVVMIMNPVTMAIGLGWMLLGAAVYVAYRRNQGLPIKKTVKVVLPEPLNVEEVEFRSVLVPFEDDPFSELTIGTAATPRRPQAARDPRDLAAQRPGSPPDRRAAAAAGGEGPVEDRAGEADRRPAGHRPRPADPSRSGAEGDHRGGQGHQGGRDRHAADLPQRHPAVRQDAAGSARQPALPRHRRGGSECRSGAPARTGGRLSPTLASRIAADVVPGADWFERYESAVVRDPRSRPRDHRQDRRGGRRPTLGRRPDRRDLRRDRRGPALSRGPHGALSPAW